MPRYTLGEAPITPAPAAPPVRYELAPESAPATPQYAVTPSPSPEYTLDNDWVPPQTPTKDRVEFDTDLKAHFISKETGEESPKPMGRFATEAAAAAATPSEPAPLPTSSVVRATGMPADPLRAPVNAVNDFVGKAGNAALDYTQGVAGPVTGLGRFGFNIADWLVGGAQHLMTGGATETPPNPFVQAGRGLVRTVLDHPTDLLGPSAQGVRENGVGYLGTARGAGELTADVASNLMLLPVLTRAASLGKAALPARAGAAIDNTVARVIPKWKWTDEMLGAEAANEGRKMAASLPLNTPQVPFGPNQVPGSTPVAARIASNDQLLAEMSNMTARDGRPMMFSGPAAGVVPGDYVKLRGSEASGQFAHSWVHPDVADIAPALKEPGQVVGVLRQFLQAWKASKTIWSPGTHLNNSMGDMMFAHLAGASPINPGNAGFYKKAAEDLQNFRRSTPSPELAEAMDSGAVRPGMVESEIRPAASKLGFLTDSPAAKRLGAAYDLEDQLFRYATYLKQRDLGLAPRDASIQVNKYFPSYSSTSQVGRELRGQGTRLGAAVGSPFTSFGLEAARIYATAAAEAPYRLASVGAFPRATTLMNLQDMGMTQEDWSDIRRNMPEHMKDRVLIPYKGPDGRLAVADWTNIVPLSSVAARGDSMSDTSVNRDFLFGGPMWNLGKMLFNYDWSTGQKVIDPVKGEDWQTGVWKGVKSLAPVPSAATSLAERVPEALGERPHRRFGEPESVGKAAAYSLFPNLEGRDPDELARGHRAQQRGGISELKGGKRSNQRNPTLSEADKERRRQNIMDLLMERKTN
jgi:hypothetical protein